MMSKDQIMDNEFSFGPKREPDIIRRIRILYVKKFLEEHSDENHFVGMREILKYLDNQRIPANPKSVRDDLKALIEYDMPLELENQKLWHLLSREFELSEIKLIVDCIASSKFLSKKKSQELIKKIESLVSIHQRKELNRQIIVSGRVKSMNETVFYSLNNIHEAIESGNYLDFNYFQYNMDKQQEFKHGGKVYHVYPRQLLYDNNNYYLFAEEGDELKTFRVDRMTNVVITEKTDEDFFNICLDTIDTESITKSMFGMFHGEETLVQMIFSKDMMDTVIDQFGKDVTVEKVDDLHFRIKTNVTVSPQFFGWVFSLGENAMIEYPLAVAKQMKDMLKERHKAYREEHSGAIYYA